jgi:hypothetical protein
MLQPPVRFIGRRRHTEEDVHMLMYQSEIKVDGSILNIPSTLSETVLHMWYKNFSLCIIVGL